MWARLFSEASSGVLNLDDVQMLSLAFSLFSLVSIVLPLIVSRFLVSFGKLTAQHFQLTKSLSLLMLGMALATLATLNFSLAFLIGLLASPLAFVQPTRSVIVRYSLAGLLGVVAPPTVIYMIAQALGLSVVDVLQDASFGWNIWGVYTAVVVWCIWWPAWLVGMINVLGIVKAEN